MRFIYPLGFLGLLSILGLILIYILKPKYEEKKISSTFIWKLSLKYQKHKIPFQWLKNSLLLILQITILVIATLILTKPSIMVKGNSNETIMILESSAGMMTTDKNQTRFEKASNDILQEAKRIAKSELVTIILAGETPTYLVRRESDSQVIEQSMKDLECELGVSNIKEALDLAKDVKEEAPNASIKLYGCKKYEDGGMVDAIDYSNGEYNAAILDFEANFVNGYYELNAEIGSFNKASKVTVVLYVNGTLTSSTFVDLAKDEIKTINLGDKKNITTFKTVEVKLDVKDALSYDNNYFLSEEHNSKTNVQLVSDNPRFIRSALNAIGGFKITTVPTTIDDTDTSENKKEVKYEGFDLYIFDGITPITMPKDGAVWIFNPEETSSLPDLLDANLDIGVNNPSVGVSYPLDYANAGVISTDAKNILEYINPENITVSKYSSIVDAKGFDILLTCNDEPVLLTTNNNGVKITVFGFELAYSNLAVSYMMPILINNLVDYSIVKVIDESVYNIGDTVSINALPGTTMVIIKGNGLNEVYRDYPIQVDVTNPGIYTITETSINGTEKNYSFFVRIDRNESDYSNVNEPLLIQLNENVKPVTQEKEAYNFVYILAGIMFVIILVEWRLQYREQY